MEQILWLFSGIVIGVLLTGLLRGWFFKPARPSLASLVQVKARYFPQLSSFRQTPERVVALLEKPSAVQKLESSLLIPIQGLVYPEQALNLGLKLAQFKGQTLAVLILVEVPQVHSMETGMGQEMEQALTIMEQVEQQISNKGVRFEVNIAKVRNNTTGICEAVSTYQAGWVILEPPKTGKQASFHGPTLPEQAGFIYTKTKCNILMLNSAQAYNNLKRTKLEEYKLWA
jgi:hypothetical protein